MMVNNTANAVQLSQIHVFWISVLVVFLFVGIVVFLIWKMAPAYMKEGPGQRPKLLTYIALILIILAVILLGLTGVLTKDHCATLLAAIAGYVLGRAGQRLVVTTKPGELSIITEPATEESPETEPATEESPKKIQKT